MDRKKAFSGVMALALATALAAPALAAGDKDRMRTDPVAGEIPLGVTVVQTGVIARGIRASKLADAEVFNDRNEKIGRIEDFIVAPDGTLTVAVIDVGGFLGMGAHRVAIPVQQFSQLSPRVILPKADKASLKQLPQFEFMR